MRLSLGLIVGVLAVAGAASAEPQKGLVEPSKPTQTPSKPAAIVLASAETVRAPTSESAQPTLSSAKRRVAPRVTSCRCGDQQVQPESQDQ